LVGCQLNKLEFLKGGELRRIISVVIATAMFAVCAANVIAQEPAPTPSPTPTPTPQTAPATQQNNCVSFVTDPQVQRQRFRFAGIRVYAVGRVKANHRIYLRLRLRGRSIRDHFVLTYRGNLKREPLRSFDENLVLLFKERLVRHHGAVVKWKRTLPSHGSCLDPEGGTWSYNIFLRWRSGGKKKRIQFHMFFAVQPAVPPSDQPLVPIPPRR
jgi:hypothetical protein